MKMLKKWMAPIRLEANECGYEEKDKRLKKMMTEKIRELTATKETNEITSKQELCWENRVEVQKAQKALPEPTRDTHESKEFDAVKSCKVMS